LSLGRVSRADASASNFERASVVLSEARFIQHVATVFPGISVSTDTGYSSLMGISNIVVSASGGNAELIIQLSANLPLDPVLRVFDSTSGLWRDFDSGSPNAVASAAVTNAGCPLPSSTNYQAGLRAGIQCVRITINDGGFNDVDGSSNGEVELIANIVSKFRLGDGSDVTAVDLNPSKGGGSSGPWLLLILLVWTGVLGVNRAYARK